MLKSEFEKLSGKTVSQEEYAKIEMVYTYYPGIIDKNCIVNICKIGMHLIDDMFKRAQEICILEEQIQKLRSRLNKLTDRGIFI